MASRPDKLNRVLTGATGDFKGRCRSEPEVVASARVMEECVTAEEERIAPSANDDRPTRALEKFLDEELSCVPTGAVDCVGEDGRAEVDFDPPCAGVSDAGRGERDDMGEAGRCRWGIQDVLVETGVIVGEDRETAKSREVGGGDADSLRGGEDSLQFLGEGEVREDTGEGEDEVSLSTRASCDDKRALSSGEVFLPLIRGLPVEFEEL